VNLAILYPPNTIAPNIKDTTIPDFHVSISRHSVFHLQQSSLELQQQPAEMIETGK
jgi:hypothetical protein